MPTITLDEEYHHDGNDALLALALAGNADVYDAMRMYEMPGPLTNDAESPRSSSSQAEIPGTSKKAAVVGALDTLDTPDTPDTRELTEPEHDQANINFIVAMYGYERKFLAEHKANHPSIPLTSARRARIKNDAFIAAEFEMSSIRHEFNEAGTKPYIYKGCRAALKTRVHFKETKTERRSLAARLLA